LLVPFLNQSLHVAWRDSKVRQLTNNFRHILNSLEHNIKNVAFPKYIDLDKFLRKGNMTVSYINPKYYVEPLKPYGKNWLSVNARKDKAFSYLEGHLQSYSSLQLSSKEFSTESLQKSDMILELFRRNLLNETTSYVLDRSAEVNSYLRRVAARNLKIVTIFGLAAVTITVYILAVSTLALNYWKVKTDQLNSKLFAVKVPLVHSARRPRMPRGRTGIDQKVPEASHRRKRKRHLHGATEKSSRVCLQRVDPFAAESKELASQRKQLSYFGKNSHRESEALEARLRQLRIFSSGLYSHSDCHSAVDTAHHQHAHRTEGKAGAEKPS
jgi:hypothetical protein